MQDYPSNSQLSSSVPKEEPKEKKIDPVVTGKVVRRKKPIHKRFVETFLGGDAHGVVGYVLIDVLVPAARDMMSDAVSQGFDRLLYGESRTGGRRRGRGGLSTGSYVSYNTFSQSSSRREEPRHENRSRRSSYDLDDIILATRVEADEVVDRLFDLVQTYDVATVADLYSIVDVSSNHVDQNWGWTDLRGLGVQRLRSGGYLLDLPRPEHLK